MKPSKALFSLLTFWAVMASAAEPKHFTQQEFEKLSRQGHPVVVDVAASWCPTCRAQKPIIDRLSKQDAYKDVAVLTVDFDNDKNVLKQFKISMQSTLIAFKGGKEVWRTVGDTTPVGIETIFKKASN